MYRTQHASAIFKGAGLLKSRIRAEALPLHASLFVVSAPWALPKAQKRQKIFPVAVGDDAHERLLRSPVREAGMFYSMVIPGILLEGPVRETGVGTLSRGQERRPGDGVNTRRRESVHASMTAEKSRDASSTDDADALSVLYEQFRRPIHSYIYRLLGSMEDADDVTQEVFVRACIAWDGLYERNNLSAWLYRIATNLCVDLLRRRKRISWWPLTYQNSNDERFESGASDDSSPFLPDSGGIPEIAEREHIRLALSNMPEEYAIALVLSAAQGVPYQEIAVILGISSNAAATRISRAKRMFAEQYQRLSKEGVEKQENRR